MEVKQSVFPELEGIEEAYRKLKQLFPETPLEKSRYLSQKYQAEVYLKREDKQQVRSYKIRGAYHKISGLSDEEKGRGVICASAGNHAQGVALSCSLLHIRGTIYMPEPTPQQKIDQVRQLASDELQIVLSGDTYDDACAAALAEAENSGAVFVHPFDDMKVIEGQATVGMELMHQMPEAPDMLFVPVGGGGLVSGLLSAFYHFNYSTNVVGIEPSGAASMLYALQEQENKALSHIDKFVDGAAVKQVGEKNFAVCCELLKEMVTVDEGKVCSTILEIYNKEALVLEPAGALSLAVLDQYAAEIKGKKVVCILSGSNNDVLRMEEIREKSLLYEGLKHYFVIRFPQRAGALREFVVDVLNPEDDISFFQYTKKMHKEKGPALVGIELKRASDFDQLIENMKRNSIAYEYVNHSRDLFRLLL
jgi:threonine dehydratase